MLASSSSEPSANVDCGAVFDETTTRSFGNLSACTWREDGASLEVLLGGDASINKGSVVSTKANALIVNTFAVSLPTIPGHPEPSLSTPVVSSLPLVMPQAALSVRPPLAQACTTVSASASATLGNAGRPFRSIEWSFGSRTSPILAAELAPYLAQSAGSTSFVIPAPNFSQAVTAVKEAVGNSFFSSTTELEIVATLTNWLEQSDQASAIVTLETEEEPMPFVSPETSQSISVYNSEEVFLAVDTLAIDTALCGVASETTTTTTRSESQVRSVVLEWDYRPLGSADWVSLQNASLMDLSFASRSLRLPAFSFDPATQHQFRVSASYSDSSPTAKKPAYIFDLTVNPARAPVAIIRGPKETSAACEFIVDASRSKDLSLRPGEVKDFSYEWSCEQVGTALPCNLSNLEEAQQARTDGTGAAGEQLLVSPSALPEGTYTFTVRVGRAQVPGSLQGTASMDVVVKNAALPPVAFTVPWSKDESVSTQQGGLLGLSKASVKGSGDSCQVPPEWGWRFALVEEEAPFKVVKFLETLESRDEATTSVELSTSDFQGSFMIPGIKYAYALLQTDTREEMDDFASQPPANLEAAIAAGARVAQSDAFLADGPPASGFISISPERGFAVTTEFSASFTGWFDEDPESLQFSFYRFPLDPSIRLTASGEAFVANDTFVPPVVEWVDSTAANHWRKLGGTLMQPYSKRTAITNYVFATGSYFLVAVAKDRLGGVSYGAFSLGPLVEAPEGGLSEEEAAQFFTKVMSTNDGNTVLNAVDAVASLASSSGDPSASAELADQALSVLESAVSFVEPTNDQMAKTGSVLTNMMETSTSSGTASAATANKAAAILDTALSSSLSEAGSGLDEEAGAVLLSSIGAVGDVFSASDAEESGSSGSTENNTDKLSALASKLGEAVLVSLPMGEPSVMSTVGEDGSGLELEVQKEELQTAEPVTAGNVEIPGSALLGVERRLQAEGAGACDSIGIQQTNWVKSNPYVWADQNVGDNSYASPFTTVKVLELKRCGKLIDVQANPPVSMQLPVGEAPAEEAPFGFEWKPQCVKFADKAWTAFGMTMLSDVNVGSNAVRCTSDSTSGSYAAIFVPVPLPPTVTATTTSTKTFTDTTTERVDLPAELSQGPSAESGLAAAGPIGLTLLGFLIVGAGAYAGYQVKTGKLSFKKGGNKVADISADKDIIKSGEPEQEPGADAGGRAARDASAHFSDFYRDFYSWAQDLPQPHIAIAEEKQTAADAAADQATQRQAAWDAYSQSFSSVSDADFFSEHAKDLHSTGSASSSLPPPPPLPWLAPQQPDMSWLTPPPPPPMPRKKADEKKLLPPPMNPPGQQDISQIPSFSAGLAEPPTIENADRVNVYIHPSFQDFAETITGLSLVKLPQLDTAGPDVQPPPPPPPRAAVVSTGATPAPPPRPKAAAAKALGKRPAAKVVVRPTSLPKPPPLGAAPDSLENVPPPPVPVAKKAAVVVASAVPKKRPPPVLPKGVAAVVPAKAKVTVRPANLPKPPPLSPAPDAVLRATVRPPSPPPLGSATAKVSVAVPAVPRAKVTPALPKGSAVLSPPPRATKATAVVARAKVAPPPLPKDAEAATRPAVRAVVRARPKDLPEPPPLGSSAGAIIASVVKASAWPPSPPPLKASSPVKAAVAVPTVPRSKNPPPPLPKSEGASAVVAVAKPQPVAVRSARLPEPPPLSAPPAAVALNTVRPPSPPPLQAAIAATGQLIPAVRDAPSGMMLPPPPPRPGSTPGTGGSAARQVPKAPPKPPPSRQRD
eukprot:TRINITY_DN870_c0_g1_i4.p1 TRINITY_DN870_c0_g1~~TRINITY_DN870_c0_g1_i4.p1  ORF type:complete len:1850 (-),score=394.28 TRINITY_DN870_c0_g1_i4:66-5369(-)